MYRRPPRSTRTYPLFPYTTLFRAQGQLPLRAGGQERTHQRDQTGKRAMIARIIEGSIANRLFIVLASIVIALAGFWAVRTTPVDALRSEERRVGKEVVRTGRSRGMPDH